MPVPVRVHGKVGDIAETSRTNVDVKNATFSLEKSKTVRPDTNIYNKPGQASHQREFILLSERTYTLMVAAAHANHLRRSQRAWSFVVEVFAFAVKYRSGQVNRRVSNRTTKGPNTDTFAQAQYIDAMQEVDVIEEDHIYRTIGCVSVATPNSIWWSMFLSSEAL
ncbi:hypothetical protein JG687_00014564 [Phytophthora cactorum]|uniref:Uncharacterized protein n=1 Tax=Phytophthora cactorum TaxID=29920 RepID=A0A8T1U191_9STRA|nr:hypothetical protein JG687_00014564 [Phytophthora cactorum]